MIYVNKLMNLFPTNQIVRENMNTPVNSGSIFIYPYDPVDRLVYIINDTYSIFNKHFAINKTVNVYVPKYVKSTANTIKYLNKVDQNAISHLIKSKCESIDIVNTSPPSVGVRSLFYDVSTIVTSIKRKIKLATDDCVLDALNLFIEAFNEFRDTHTHRYLLISLDGSVGVPIPDSRADITSKLYKNGFDFLRFFIYALNKNESYIRDIFKDIIIIFSSKNKIFKLDFSALPPYNKEKDGNLMNQLLIAIKKTATITADIPDNLKEQENIIDREKEKLKKPEHIKSILDRANKTGIINMDEYEIVKPEDKVKLDAVKDKDKFMNRKMNELLDKATDDKSTLMLDQYVKTVADNPDDVKAAIGATIIQDIKNEIIKKDTKITTPKEKKLVEKLDNVTIRDKDKVTVIQDFKNMKITPEKFQVEVTDQSITENSFVNFNKSYDKYVKNVHVKRIAKHFSKCDVPLYVQNIQIDDISDRFNYLEKYKFTFKDADGKQSTINIKMPKFINGKFLYMNGTKFVLYNQLVAFPVVKVGADVVVTTSRNKATLSYKGSKYISPTQAKLSKGLDKLDIDKNAYKGILSFGDYYTANVVSNKTTVEYQHISKQITGIKTENIDFTFKNDESISRYGDHTEDGYLVLGLYKGKEIHISLENDKCYGDPSIDGMDLTEMLVKITSEDNNELSKYFKSLYDDNIDPNLSDLVTGLSKDDIPDLYKSIIESKTSTTSLVQSHIKIMGRWIPLIYVLMYTNGLFSTLERAKVDFRLVYHIDPKHPELKRSKPRIVKSKQFLIETHDAWLIFNMSNIEDISLTYPLTKLDFTAYKTAQLENKDFMSSIIEDYGGSVNLPLYLDRFRENFVDPITADILEDHNIASDFLGLMLYANGLLGTGKSTKDIDLSQQRLRGEETVISAMYEAISVQYEEYSAKKKRGNIKSEFTINENAVLNILHELPSLKPYSSLNPINEQTEVMTAMFKGHRGSNMDRAYTVEKRMFDASFYGIVGLSSPAGAGIGINKQLVLDPKIVSPKGYLDTKGQDGATGMKTKNLLTVVETLHPFAVNHDDPQRVAMNLSQAQQILPVKDSDPMYTTYGVDSMLAKMSDDFSVVAKQEGSIISMDNHSIVIQYIDKTKEVRLLNTIEKNSAKNFYIKNPMKIAKGMKVGKKVKKGDVIAYNPEFYKEFAGWDDPIFTPGPMLWVAVVSDDVVYEDSTAISRTTSMRCSKRITKVYDIQLDKAAKLKSYKLYGDTVISGDQLVTFNKTVDDEFINQFMEDEDSDLLTLEKKVKRAGKIIEVSVYHACAFTDLSKSIRDFIGETDRQINVMEKNINTYGSDFEKNVLSKKSRQVPAGTKINGVKLDEDKVLIEYAIESVELLGIGDKGTYNSAIKGIVAAIREDNEMPLALTTNRRVDACLRSMSIGNRKIYSIYYNMAINKAMWKIGEMLKEIMSKY